MPAQHITDQDFEAKVLKSDKPVMVDFFAVWCGPCKMAAPVIDKLSDEFAGKLDIYKLDVDENMETARAFGVQSIPTVMMFKDGKVVETKTGFGGDAGYRNMINGVLSK